MHEENCAFCKIIENRSDAQILFESQHAIAFLDINPINLGHALVVSKEHFKDFSELPGDVLHDAISVVRTVANAIVESVRPDGFNIFNNNGAAAGQSVFHFHFHIAPRHDGDGLKVRPKLKAYESSQQMSEYAERIRSRIKVKSETR